MIGNSNYPRNIGVLKNPVNDATDFAKELQNSNFEVQLLTNATYGQMRAAMLRFKEKVRELTSRTRGVSTERRAEELSRYLRGWIGYFGQCQTPSVLQGLEEWTRRRLRSAIWKQWPKRFAELRKRGVGQDLAAKAAGSAHGPWQLANSPALAIALPNAYFVWLGIPPLTPRR